MVFSFFNSNYKPNDFLGKSARDILEKMDLDKIDTKFFETYEKSDDADFKQLSTDVKGAIQLVIDLKNKDKMIIYDKCYKIVAAPPMQAPPMQAPPMQAQQPQMQAQQAQMRAPFKYSIKPGHNVSEEEEEEQVMVGGRRMRKRIRKTTKRIRKTTKRIRKTTKHKNPKRKTNKKRKTSKK
jgi:hypothetical protein